MQDPRMVKPAFEEGKKMEKDKMEYQGKIPVSGKTPKTPENLKNKVIQKASQKFSKIINIIK